MSHWSTLSTFQVLFLGPEISVWPVEASQLNRSGSTASWVMVQRAEAGSSYLTTSLEGLICSRSAQAGSGGDSEGGGRAGTWRRSRDMEEEQGHGGGAGTWRRSRDMEEEQGHGEVRD